MLYSFDFDRIFYNKRLLVNLQRKSRTPADRNYEPYGLQRSVICVNNMICLEIILYRVVFAKRNGSPHTLFSFHGCSFAAKLNI